MKMSTPQFHTDPLSSTHQLHTRTTPFQPEKSLSSTPKTRQFNTKTPSVQLQKTPQFHPSPEVPHQKLHSSTPSVQHIILSSTPVIPLLFFSVKPLRSSFQFNAKLFTSGNGSAGIEGKMVIIFSSDLSYTLNYTVIYIY